MNKIALKISTVRIRELKEAIKIAAFQDELEKMATSSGIKKKPREKNGKRFWRGLRSDLTGALIGTTMMSSV